MGKLTKQSITTVVYIADRIEGWEEQFFGLKDVLKRNLKDRELFFKMFEQQRVFLSNLLAAFQELRKGHEEAENIFEPLANLDSYMQDIKHSKSNPEPEEAYAYELQRLAEFEERVNNVARVKKTNTSYTKRILGRAYKWALATVLALGLTASTPDFAKAQEKYSTEIPKELLTSSLLRPTEFDKYQGILIREPTEESKCTMIDAKQKTHEVVFSKGFYTGSFPYKIDGKLHAARLPPRYILNVYEMHRAIGDVIIFNLYRRTDDNQYSVSILAGATLNDQGTDLEVDRAELSKIFPEQ